MKDCLEEAKQIAKDRGGICLSDTCNTTKSKILLECKNKHRWCTSFANIKYHNQWCKKCVSFSQRKTIENAQSLAAERNGICLSDTYDNNHTKLKWKCENDHIWYSTFNKISIGRRCPFCSKKAKLNINIAKNIAKLRNGVCLSTEYNNLRSKLIWECNCGHIWKATLNNVKNHDRWCPK